ncbi:RNA polymerase sigma factor [Asticcacaulis sp. DW145]|uniref:RNA polymerase sigma factor n=1 Tax=Asticcacaulis sp. DW145 TaxID=3095608 RepID=UPI0030D08683
MRRIVFGSRLSALSDDVFNHLFRSYHGEIDAYFLRNTRNAALAEDLTQETFARLAVMGTAISAVKQKRPYLYRIARNLLIDHLRRSGRLSVGQPESIAMDCVPDRAPSPEDLVSASEQSKYMLAALMRLPQRTRQVFVLTRLDGLSYGETATALNISESTVQKHLAMATAHMMQHLETDHRRR